MCCSVNVQMVQISSKYIMIDGRRVNVALKQDHKNILLSVPNDCNFFFHLPY